jgi:non-specific serine/threonine protein kinase
VVADASGKDVAEHGAPRATAFGRRVTDALAHVHDLPYLQSHPLAAGLSDGGEMAGRALQRVLLSAIDSLAPGRGSPARAGGLAHRALELRYVEALAVPTVCARLGVSRSGFYRAHRRGLSAVAALVEQELGAAADRPNGWPSPPGAEQPRRTNLPAELTSFVGREEAVAAVTELLGRARLVTVVGAGGVGKTRLALRVAAGQLGAHPDGVWLVELGAVADPQVVPAAVARALGVPDVSGRPPAAVLPEYLRARRLLLLVDNCEHLLEASARLLEPLLRGCPGLRVLATSRAALGVAGEVSWRVPSLGLPAPADAASAERLVRHESASLFAARAAAANPAFALTDRDAPAVAQICRRLDGIPLALELAAALVRGLAVRQIAARLDDRFRLLTGGSRTVLPRQQTLLGTLDWSHDLLSGGERAVLRRLAVFAGGWELEAAEAVCAGSDLAAGDVLGLLLGLVDQSLVVAEEQDGTERYRLLETVRQYAWERLDDAGETGATRSRHRDWYLALAERAEPDLWGTDPRPWLDRLEAEHDNLRAALEWCLTSDVESGQRLAGSLWRFWERRGYLTEGRSWLAKTVAGAAGPAGPPTAARAGASLGAAYLARDQGDVAAARSWFEASLADFRAVGDRYGIGSSLRGLGLLAQSESDHSRAQALFEATVALFRETGHPLEMAWTLRNLGILAQIAGDVERANALFEESLSILRPSGDKPGTGRVLGSLGLLARARGAFGRARALLEESRDCLVAAGDKRGVSMALGALGSLARIQGDREGARELLGQSLALGREMGDRSCIARGLAVAGVMAAELAAHARGARLLGAASAVDPRLRAALEPDERADLDAGRAAAERALGAEAFAAAWAHGRAMSVDEAIAQASTPVAGVSSAPPPAAAASRRHSAAGRASARATGPAPAGGEPAVGRATTRAAPPASGPAAAPRRPRLPGGLTEREAEVLRLVAGGKTNRGIAADLLLSEYTVMRHLSNIFRKLGTSSRAAAASFAVREGLS